MNRLRCCSVLLALLAATGFASPVFAQAAAAPAASSASTPANLPPGATSRRGNKAAVPDKGASAAVDPMTGSTPGLPPGARSARGDKAATPKGKGQPASGASAPG